jgi:glycosyltransferase involved in cell wall biosynthesis
MKSVMHMVDTLEAGGAETMCVLLANGLAERGWEVHLCATRRGGMLERRISSRVRLLKLERRGRFDVRAVQRLKHYVKEHEVGLLHAHGTAVFLAAVVRMMAGSVKVVWHIHAGALSGTEWARWAYGAIRRWVDGVAAVNEKLVEWAVEKAGFRRERVWLVRNFAGAASGGVGVELPGAAGFRIVQVANVRPQKDHGMMLRAMARIVREEPRASLLVVGQCGEEGHGGKVRRMAQEMGLGGAVHFLGPRDDVGAVLRGCDVGVLSSASEGLPVALLEYGEAGLAVACTDVGDCRKVVDGCGYLVKPGDDAGMAEAVLALLRDERVRAEMGRSLQQRVREDWSREAALRRLEEAYAEILD